MKNAIKTELWKATHNIFFALSLILGIGIILLDVAQNVITVDDLVKRNIEAGLMENGTHGISLFTRWIAINGFTFGSIYFFLIWPILAAMPHGWSYAQEVKTGVINQYFVRTTRKTYFTAKYIAVFLSGGIAVSFPVIANLLLNALFCPATVPEVTHLLTAITDGYFLSALFYTHPWCYCLIWCFVDFLFGGMGACLCFLIGHKIRFPVMVMLFPFAILYLLKLLSSVVRQLTQWNIALTPLDQAIAGTLNANPGWMIFASILLFTSISFAAGLYRVKKYEVA